MYTAKSLTFIISKNNHHKAIPMRNIMNHFKIDKCRALAMRAHEEQKRKYNGGPYFSHPNEVARLVTLFAIRLELPKDVQTDMTCTAYLHDVLEDCPHISESEIIHAGGDRVFGWVCALTNPSKDSPLKRAERKAIDRQFLATQCLEVRIIKLCDRFANLFEMLDDLKAGVLSKSEIKFVTGVYADESELLLDALAGTNDKLEEMVRGVIKELRECREN